MVAGIVAVGLGSGVVTLISVQIAGMQTVYAATQGEQVEDTQSQSTKTVATAAVANANQSETTNSQILNTVGTAATVSGVNENQTHSTTDQTERTPTGKDATKTVTSADLVTTDNGASETPTPETSDYSNPDSGVSDIDATDQSMVVTVNGQVILATAKERQSGNLTLNNQSDLDYVFNLTGTITIGDGDGVSIGFHIGIADEVGHNGDSLGFAGLENAIGWKADMFNNANDGQNDNDTVVIDGEKVSYFGANPADYSQFGTFVYTEAHGITIEKDVKSAKTISSSYDTIHVDYAAATQVNG